MRVFDSKRVERVAERAERDSRCCFSDGAIGRDFKSVLRGVVRRDVEV